MNTTDGIALALTAATAAIHFFLAATEPAVTVIFTLNGLGYLALAAALWLPASPVQGQAWPRYVLLAYTALTIVLYVVFSLALGDWTLPWGPIDKVIELALLAVLWAGRPSQ